MNTALIRAAALTYALLAGVTVHADAKLHAAATSHGDAAPHAEDCAALVALTLPHVTVTNATAVNQGEPVADAAATASFCRIQASSKPTADSDIRFELWIPLGSAWNGRFEQVGNGGFAGAIPTRAMARALTAGFAVAGTDDGHRSADMTDASWALHHDQKVVDYGWRAISETTRASKYIVLKLKGKEPDKSYFVGCSDGGREALMMAQRFPAYFDGIVAGAPAYSMTRLLTSGAQRSATVNVPAAHFSAASLAVLQDHVLASCAGGAKFLKDPRQCRPDLEGLKCQGTQTTACLTDAQIATARALYRSSPDPVTHTPSYGVLPGAEAVRGSWDAWLTGGEDGSQPAALGFTGSYLANMVMEDPHFDPAQVTEAKLARAARHYAPMMDASDPNLSAFKARGGKLIQYHGWNDPGIAPGYSLEYRARVVGRMGAVDDFYRLYMVPGMLHCAGGDAPTQVDWQAAIEAWVQSGTAPGALTASDGRGGTQTVLPYRDE